MNHVSAVIITKNEEKNIARCLKSVAWANEIVVIDSGSTDRTLEICANHGCRVIQSAWQGFGPTKKQAVNAATHDWIFSIDADEEVTPALQNIICQIMENPTSAGYRIKRNSFYVGQLIHHCGWDRDYPLRLFNRQHGNFNDKLVHESVEIEGSKATVEAPLLHYTYPTIRSHLDKINLYSELGAETLFRQGKKSSLPRALIAGMAKFVKMYLLQRGFLDGRIGFVLSLNSAYGVYLKYLKLWEKNHQS